jgi:hypothetical protein
MFQRSPLHSLAVPSPTPWIARAASTLLTLTPCYLAIPWQKPGDSVGRLEYCLSTDSTFLEPLSCLLRVDSERQGDCQILWVRTCPINRWTRMTIPHLHAIITSRPHVLHARFRCNRTTRPHEVMFELSRYCPVIYCWLEKFDSNMDGPIHWRPPVDGSEDVGVARRGTFWIFTPENHPLKIGFGQSLNKWGTFHSYVTMLQYQRVDKMWLLIQW